MRRKGYDTGSSRLIHMSAKHVDLRAKTVKNKFVLLSSYVEFNC